MIAISALSKPDTGRPETLSPEAAEYAPANAAGTHIFERRNERQNHEACSGWRKLQSASIAEFFSFPMIHALQQLRESRVAEFRLIRQANFDFLIRLQGGQSLQPNREF